jgi:hypothetical protein
MTRQLPTHGPERPMVPSAQWSRAKPPAGLHRGKGTYTLTLTGHQ